MGAEERRTDGRLAAFARLSARLPALLWMDLKFHIPQRALNGWNSYKQIRRISGLALSDKRLIHTHLGDMNAAIYLEL